MGSEMCIRDRPMHIRMITARWRGKGGGTVCAKVGRGMADLEGCRPTQGWRGCFCYVVVQLGRFVPYSGRSGKRDWEGFRLWCRALGQFFAALVKGWRSYNSISQDQSETLREQARTGFDVGRNDCFRPFFYRSPGAEKRPGAAAHTTSCLRTTWLCASATGYSPSKRSLGAIPVVL